MNFKKHAKERFCNDLELNLTENFTDNKRDFWRLTRYFVKHNTASSSIPPLYTTDANNEMKKHVTDKERSNCLMITSRQYLEFLMKIHNNQ